MEHQTKIVAVDGPAGSGKTSVCAAVSAAMRWTHVNTGALYRAAGYILDADQLASLAPEVASPLIESFIKDLRWEPTSGAIFYKGRDITAEINSSKVGQASSKIAKVPELRRLLLPVQRQWAREAPVGAIVEGRDVGTVVFPDAHLKIFLTASLEQRARRRLAQLQASAKGPIPPLLELIEQLKQRDLQDQSRNIAPFLQAKDAIVFDTSPFGFDECVRQLVAMIAKHLN